VHLGSYAIERWLAGPFEEDLFRALARVVLAESAAWAEEGVAPSPVPALATMMHFVRTNLDLRLDVAQIAASADCSPTTAQRHFGAGTGGSVQRWVRRTKMTEAALLLRSSGLRVNEVATLLGYRDALHFSRLFAQTFGVAPSRYAAGHMRP
jgi:transcriptional regulator GlxA family with amidase domain